MRNQCRMILIALFMLSSQAGGSDAALDNWPQVVRNSPYWISQGVFDNLKTIRRWVLAEESFCEEPNRHIVYDRRGTFLGYIDNAQTADETQAKLDQLRQNLAKAGRVDYWVAGSSASSGYPFALSCFQPHAQLDDALARYSGEEAEAKLWGTWDGMRVGSADDLLSLHQAITAVYQDRQQQGRISMPASILSTLAGKTLIESAGQKHAHSAANARGIMQLSEPALKDCGLEPRFYFHRLAQVDCALRLLEQNHRNLSPVFEPVFGHLPESKAQHLYDLLLIQAYHGGVGRVQALLTDDELAKPARYFAEHHERFSAGDIALGMIFHNLGRDRFGFASLYYVVDVGIAQEAACQKFADLPGC
jgi:hypothetical protein